MWQFINNIRIKTPADQDYRPLNSVEIRNIERLFYRKTKEHFEFEDIAKELSGGKRNGRVTYGYKDERGEIPYRFNFKMKQGVPGCPTTAGLRDIFGGDDWLSTMCSMYSKGGDKTEEQILNDVWHVLFSFDDNNKLREWAKRHLQLDDSDADKFVGIKIKQGYAALSLNAICKMLPWLRIHYRYDEAVFIANLPSIVPIELWNNDDCRNAIIRDICGVLDDYTRNPTIHRSTKKQEIADTLLDNHGIDYNQSSHLYEPSCIETYPKAQPNKNGIVLLGSPRTSSVRNPMAMRALFRLRALVNQLIKEGKIDKATKINIEFARGLNDANKRNAIERYQRDNEDLHRNCAAEITKLIKAECGCDITPSDDDILKYKLWIEQDKHCLYTGEQISICDFIGVNPKYDIEHTVPRSRGGDNSQMNKTLCQLDFNRRIKRDKLPAQLPDHANIMAKIEQLNWTKNIEEIEKRIYKCNRDIKTATTKEAKDKAIRERHYQRMKLDYWQGKLMRFTITEVPAGFSNRQGVDIGIIGKYAKMYLETVFDRVSTVKGATTADFRKAWGLQDEYTKKERVNHVHHCIDAITIACIGSGAYQKWAQFQRDAEHYYWHNDSKPVFEKPWPTFTEDVKAVASEILVSHHTANNLPKHSRKKLRVRGKVQCNAKGNPIYVQGDTARASLHKETFYGLITHHNTQKFVVRKDISNENFREIDIDNIVDEVVKQKVKDAKEKYGFPKIKDTQKYPIWMNETKGIQIKKVRVFISHTLSPRPLGNKVQRDLSKHKYKQHYYVASDGNYCMAIYEGECRGKVKRSFRIVNNLDAVRYYNGKSDYYDLVPKSDADDYPLKAILRVGTMVLFYEKYADELRECSKAELAKRLYKVTGMNVNRVKQASGKINSYGMLTLKHHQEARPARDYKPKKGEWKEEEEYRPAIIVSHIQLNALIEGYDFELTVTGEIKFKR